MGDLHRFRTLPPPGVKTRNAVVLAASNIKGQKGIATPLWCRHRVWLPPVLLRRSQSETVICQNAGGIATVH